MVHRGRSSRSCCCCGCRTSSILRQWAFETLGISGAGGSPSLSFVAANGGGILSECLANLGNGSNLPNVVPLFGGSWHALQESPLVRLDFGINLVTKGCLPASIGFQITLLMLLDNGTEPLVAWMVIGETLQAKERKVTRQEENVG